MAIPMKNRYKLMLNSNTSKSRTTCVAYGCGMRSGTNALSEIKMYAFPKDPVLRRRWELATRLANFKAHNKSRLCSLHFITGKPSKDTTHPDYIPSVFVFNKNGQNLKSLKKKISKKFNSSMAESVKNLPCQDDTVAPPCGIQSFCGKCFSVESVSEAFNMSLAPLNQNLAQLMLKLKDMEKEREQLYKELANCKEEIHQLREAHQHCMIQSTSMHSKPSSIVSVPSTVSDGVTDFLESLSSNMPITWKDVYDAESVPSPSLEHDFLQSDNHSKNKRKKRLKCLSVDSNGASVSSTDGKSPDSNSAITIVYLNR